MPKINFVDKTFAGGSKTTKFVKAFSLESFPLYSTRLGACFTQNDSLATFACYSGIKETGLFA